MSRNIEKLKKMLDCFCWMNLMPMIKIENCKKSNKINIERIQHQKDKLKIYSEHFPQLDIVINEYIKRYNNKFEALLKTSR